MASPKKSVAKNQNKPKETEPKASSRPAQIDDGPHVERQVRQYLGWEGPLPPPQFLGKFSEVVTDGAERVFRQFEAEAEHRRKMDTDGLRVQSRDMLIGKVFAFLFVMAMIGAAVYAISKGNPVLAGVLGTSVLGTVVWGFVRVAGDAYPEKQKETEQSD